MVIVKYTRRFATYFYVTQDGFSMITMLSQGKQNSELKSQRMLVNMEEK
jgi:hypothetical protein